MKVGAALIGAAIAAASIAAGIATAATSSGSTAAHSGHALCQPGRVNVGATMQAVQSVMGQPPKSGGQHVAHRALLYRWTGQRWEHAATSAWLWSYAANGQSTSSWKTFDTGAAATAQFNVATGHYYGVVVQFYWYANSDVGAGSAAALAQHQDMGGPSNGYCRV
jgi:hypothetical protein